MKKALIFFLSIFFFIGVTNANNIQISNVGIIGQNTTLNYSFVKFDLSWENSWRISVGPANWDAAWIFVKFRVNNGDWTHANVHSVASGYTVPADVTVSPALEGLYGVGAFLHRSTDGSGNVNWQNIQVRWNYGSNGVGDNDLVDVQVFAIEMVYVPQAAFVVGGAGGTEIGKFYTYPTTSNSFSITSEAAITVGTSVDNLYYSIVGAPNAGDQAGPIPAAFPKGFNAFYCMKYEVSQDQWVSFFNTLTNTQKANRDITDAAHKNSDAEVWRNTVAWSGSGNATTTTPNRPVNYVNPEDAKAYLDWAALRPMTELEFEKACRGTLPVVANEYAWGNNNIASSTYSLINDGTPNENIANPGIGTGNASGMHLAAFGPVRCGIYAASAVNKTREETGGSYYGIMELSGNLRELALSVGVPEHRAFTGNHGNGALATNGDANVANWSTFGIRGGDFFYEVLLPGQSFVRLQVSDRIAASTMFTSGGFSSPAARGVRTAN